MSLGKPQTLKHNADNHDRDEFTALENNLSWIIEIDNGGIWKKNSASSS